MGSLRGGVGPCGGSVPVKGPGIPARVAGGDGKRLDNEGGKAMSFSEFSGSVMVAAGAFDLAEGWLKGALIFLIIVVGVAGVGLAVSSYIKDKNLGRAVSMLAGTVVLMVVGGSIFWIAGLFATDVGGGITEADNRVVDVSDLTSDYDWSSGGGGGDGGTG